MTGADGEAGDDVSGSGEGAEEKGEGEGDRDSVPDNGLCQLA